MKLPHSLERANGFTILELLLTIAIVSITAALASPFLQTFQLTADLDTQASTVSSTLRRAQQYSIQGRNTGSWGVYFDTSASQFILFNGVSYFDRDQELDQEFDYNEQIVISTDFGDEIIFSEYLGVPSESGSISMMSSNNALRTIDINEEGVVDVSY